MPEETPKAMGKKRTRAKVKKPNVWKSGANALLGGEERVRGKSARKKERSLEPTVERPRDAKARGLTTPLKRGLIQRMRQTPDRRKTIKIFMVILKNAGGKWGRIRAQDTFLPRSRPCRKSVVFRRTPGGGGSRE